MNKLTTNQKRELENILIRVRNKPSTEVKEWAAKQNPPINQIWRCPKCQDVFYFYPFLIHMDQKHGVSNYYKTISNLHKYESW